MKLLFRNHMKGPLAAEFRHELSRVISRHKVVTLFNLFILLRTYSGLKIVVACTQTTKKLASLMHIWITQESRNQVFCSCILGGGKWVGLVWKPAEKQTCRLFFSQEFTVHSARRNYIMEVIELLGMRRFFVKINNWFKELMKR